ncbi:MAG: hypothetical protein BMS9Abin28_0651 [Anaerolineae bacterium]|nr:MAG: hypothetical protein BMS9Abin28_0651 [Anaerolineae bacterium]
MTPIRDHMRPRTVLLLAALAALILPLLAACGNPTPRIVVEPTSQDLGERAQERIELAYTVRNAGDALLIIEKVSTSCGCTVAELDRTEIPPGETAQLLVSLDPVEDDLFGDVKRVIYLRSNDPDAPEVSVEFNVQINKP